MNFLQRALHGLAKRAVKWSGIPLRDPALVKMFGHGEETTSGIDVNEDNAPEISAVFACINLIASSKAQATLCMLEETKDGRKHATANPLYELLAHQPNPEMTAFTFWETLTNHAVSYGNGYAEIEAAENDPYPFALWPIHARRVVPGYNQARQFGYQVNPDPNAGTEEDLQERWIPAEKMYHLRGLGDAMAGWSVIKLFREGLGITKAAENTAGALFGRGLQPSGILRHPGELSEIAQKNLRKTFNQNHQGPENSGNVMILEEGMTYEKMSIPPDDAQFLQSREFQVVEIARIFNCPPHMIRDLSRSTNNNIEQQAIEFVIYTMGPWFKRAQQECRRKLLRPADRRKYTFKHDTSFLIQADILNRFNAYAIGRNAGILSANECRDGEDLDRRGTEGDALWVPVNMEVLGPKHHPDNQDVPIAGGQVQSTALNGAQVSSLLLIMQAVADNSLDPKSAAQLVRIALPNVSDDAIKTLLAPYMKGNS